MAKESIKKRLAYLRQEIEAERISQAEIAELQSLKEHIDPSDTLLLEWAGVPENGSEEHNPPYKQPCDIMYHLFCNGADAYESNIEKVFSILEEWIKNDLQDIRIYKQTEWDENEGIFLDGDCIFSIGAFPM